MTPAKKEYYEFKKIADEIHEGLRDPIHNYVEELELEKERYQNMIYELNNDNMNLKKLLKSRGRV